MQVSVSDFRDGFTQLVLEVPLPVASHAARPLTGRLVLASWPPRGTGDISVEAGYGRLCAWRGSPAVFIVEGRLALTLPAGSGAILAMQNQGEAGEKAPPIHPIATVENEKSPARGGPWTPKLKEFFDKAGMSMMEDDANKVAIPGHKGPHPEQYHQEVFRRLGQAVKSCEDTVQCREALTRELKLLADQLRTAGSRLNMLLAARSITHWRTPGISPWSLRRSPVPSPNWLLMTSSSTPRKWARGQSPTSSSMPRAW